MYNECCTCERNKRWRARNNFLCCASLQSYLSQIIFRGKISLDYRISEESRNSRSYNNDFTHVNSPLGMRDYLSCPSFSSECDQLQAGLMNASKESLNSCSVCAVVMVTYCLNRFLWYTRNVFHCSVICYYLRKNFAGFILDVPTLDGWRRTMRHQQIYWVYTHKQDQNDETASNNWL